LDKNVILTGFDFRCASSIKPLSFRKEAMQNILLAGQDSRLLSTRAAVLKKTGANVICCGASEALKLVRSKSLDLVVLCHSLVDGEAEMIAGEAHRSSQRPKVLLVILTSDQSREIPHRDANKFDATTLPDPAALIAHATELLQRSPDYPSKGIVNQQSHAL
jgi:DNA-binding response OmpR family regulator